MVARRFVVDHHGTEFFFDYETDDGLEVLKFQIFSLTAVLPDDQMILAGAEDVVVTESSDLGSITEKLRLVSIQDDSEPKPNPSNQLEISDEEFARILQAEEEALLFQQFQAGEDRGEFEGKIRTYVEKVKLYEDPVRQEAARKSVPVNEVEEEALVSLAKEGKFNPSKDEEDHAFLLQLLFWFKQSFRWVNSPPCDNCSSQTGNIGMGDALPCEIKFGASRVELYRCTQCSRITRFPRYNDPMKLLETRSGRCGEWANCFTLYCRAFGYESRLVLDFTDHVWTECYSKFLGRWMHLDPCEGIYDNPLLYEKGWNKNLNYAIAISKDGVQDVTKRYTRKWHEVLSRRNLTTEAIAASALSTITKECRTGFSSEALTLLELRDKKEAEELEREVYRQFDASISLPGRQSGAIEWRKARSEFGSAANFSSSSCPVRICVDAHVTNIYNSLVPLLSHILDSDLSKPKVLLILGVLKGLLVDLRSKPFKERKSILNLDPSVFHEKLLPCIEGFLSALSMKGKLGNDGDMYVALAGDTVQTALALPVALDAVDEIIENLSSETKVGKDVMKFPKLNRLSSGLVIGSGEEIPRGIATAAFDGSRLSKWEEPNGAKGCWLIYKVSDDCMHELESYELISANDVPERDPMDWVVEGSDDGGLTWNFLDKQSYQVFEKRFQRRFFTVKARRMSNTFRFRFLAGRNPEANSRFQIGGIDLYTKSIVNNQFSLFQ